MKIRIFGPVIQQLLGRLLDHADRIERLEFDIWKDRAVTHEREVNSALALVLSDTPAEQAKGYHDLTCLVSRPDLDPTRKGIDRYSRVALSALSTCDPFVRSQVLAFLDVLYVDLDWPVIVEGLAIALEEATTTTVTGARDRQFTMDAQHIIPEIQRALTHDRDGSLGGSSMDNTPSVPSN